MPARKACRPTLAAVLALSALAAGCAPRSERRFQPGTNPSTVAPDRANFPTGTTIPPAGFGVDLVERGAPVSPEGPKRMTLASAHESPGVHP